MDVYYMSDSIQYGSFRNPLYRDYEKFPYGTLENTLNSPPKSGGGIQQQRNQTSSTVAGQGKSKGKSGKDSCPFCKEQKKRPLGAYMRKRGQRITTESISEDVAEEDEGAAELRDDFEEGASSSSSCSSSPSGSPSAAELATGEQQHNHHHHRHESGGYGRQQSQDSGCEAK
uniref:(northern house mosquito) hypothetical protein n=1 Tax=Culex pipiens TaxID=7175 RepID=A0A8D8J1P0_CULPI